MSLSPSRTITTRFILIQTHHPGNVGAAARALKTMGFDELVLVSPKDPNVLNNVQTKDRASGAINVLQNANICTTLDEALQGTHVWCATAMPHDMCHERPKRNYYAPRKYFDMLLNKNNVDEEYVTQSVPDASNQESPNKSNDIRIAFCFGNERLGMKDEDVEKCHVILGIPTNPEFGSLNLASAVQLIAYDWREALGGFPV